MAIRNLDKVNAAVKQANEEKINAEKLRIEHINGLFQKIRAMRQDITDAVDTYKAIRDLDGTDKFATIGISHTIRIGYQDGWYVGIRGYIAYGSRTGKDIYINYYPHADTFECWWNGSGMCGTWEYRVRAYDDNAFLPLLEEFVIKAQPFCNSLFDFVASL